MTDAEAAAILKRTTDNVEAMYTKLVNASRGLSVLALNEKAYCNELRQYNLYAMACYQWQLSMIQSFKAMNVQGVPASPKFPTLFKIAGKSGTESLNIQCSTLQGLGGLNEDGTVKKDAIEIVTTDQQLLDPNAQPPVFDVDPNQIFGKTTPGMGLEPVTVVTIVLVGVLILIGLTIVKSIVSSLVGQGVEEERTRQARMQIDAFNSTIAARSDCFNKCLQTGSPAADCAKTCEAAFKADIPGIPGGMGTLGMIGLGVVAVTGFWIWTRRKKIANAGRRLSAKISPDDDDDGADEPVMLTRSMRKTAHGR